MQTTKYGIIWSENVHFVTNLPVPLTGTGGLYPRVQDFSDYLWVTTRMSPGHQEKPLVSETTTDCRLQCIFVFRQPVGIFRPLLLSFLL